jgi:hypothetical protein
MRDRRADGSLPAEDDRNFLSKMITSPGAAAFEAAAGEFHMDIGMALKHHAESAGVGGLPDAERLSQALGREVVPDTLRALDPGAGAGTVAAFHLDAGSIQVARLGESAYRTYTRLKFLHREVPGVGDEAIRLKASGTLIARRGPDAVMVVVTGPDLSGDQRDQVQQVVAEVCLASFASPSLTGPAPVPGDHRPPPPPEFR